MIPATTYATPPRTIDLPFGRSISEAWQVQLDRGDVENESTRLLREIDEANQRWAATEEIEIILGATEIKRDAERDRASSCSTQPINTISRPKCAPQEVMAYADPVMVQQMHGQRGLDITDGKDTHLVSSCAVLDIQRMDLEDDFLHDDHTIPEPNVNSMLNDVWSEPRLAILSLHSSRTLALMSTEQSARYELCRWDVQMARPRQFLL